MNWWLVGCFALLGVSAAAAVSAQPGEEAGEICLALAHGWSGSLSEARNIRSEPIAPSFRAMIDEGGCTRFQLVKESLINWHIAFGDERSTAAALSYLHAELLRDLPEPSRYAQALVNARQALGSSSRVKQRAASDLRRFERLSQAEHPYRQVAQTALAAAEEFRSLPLLDRSEAAIQALQERVHVLAAADASGGERLNLEGDQAVVTELRMRAAVLRADLTRSAADIGAAETLVRSANRPHFAAVAEAAYSGGSSFCDISEGFGSKAEVEKACSDDDLLAERAIGYWRNRAMLDLVIGAPANGSDEIALRLLEQERTSGGGRCCGFGNSSDLLRLHLMLFDRHRRAFGEPVGTSKSDQYEDWQQALDQLGRAERMVPPFEAPARFRRIAEEWLMMWGKSGELEESAPRELPTSLHRHAAYLRRLLPHLDEIAAGME